MQATSDKTASANFTQTSGTVNSRGIANNLTNGKTGYQPYYQWGRKDAFRSAQYTASPAANTSLIYSVTTVTVGTTIKNPAIFYKTNDNTPSAYSPIYYNAWNATYTSYSKEITSSTGLDSVVKTIYDPCPVGYTVSPANTFTGLATGNMPVDGVGRKYTNNGKILYFPFSGCRETASGALGYVGEYGLDWVAIAGDTSYGRMFSFSNSTLMSMCSSSGGCFRSRCCSIRPVREN